LPETLGERRSVLDPIALPLPPFILVFHVRLDIATGHGRAMLTEQHRKRAVLLDVLLENHINGRAAVGRIRQYLTALTREDVRVEGYNIPTCCSPGATLEIDGGG